MKVWICVSLLSFLVSQVQCQEKKVDLRELEFFYGIEVGQSIELYLNSGNKESARVEIFNGNSSDVLTEIANGNLQISMRQGKVKNFFKNVKVKVYLTYTKLKKIHANSSSKIFSLGVIKTPQLNIKVTSAASVELSLDVDKTLVEVSSAGSVNLKGKTKSLHGTVNSAGGLKALQLHSRYAKIKANSAGLAEVAAAQEFHADAASGATIHYRGNPKTVVINSSSGGSIKKEN